MKKKNTLEDTVEQEFQRLRCSTNASEGKLLRLFRSAIQLSYDQGWRDGFIDGWRDGREDALNEETSS